MANNQDKNKPSLNSKFFHDYTVQVSKEMIQKYARAYESYETLGNYWRNELPYSAQIEQDLVANAKLFIRTLPTANGISTDLQFLRTLIKGIADYLSGYTVRSSYFIDRRHAQRAMFDTLFTNSPYIKRLIESQQQKRACSYQAARKRQRIARRAMAEYDRAISNQVQTVFDEAQRTPRKR